MEILDEDEHSAENNGRKDVNHGILRRLLTDRQLYPVRQEIITLFERDEMTSYQIADKVNGRLGLVEGTTPEAAAKIVRRLLKRVIEPDIRDRIIRSQHARVAKKNQDTISTGRDEWMDNQGHFVWSSQHTEAFMDIIVNEKFTKPESRQSIAKRKREGNRPRKRRQPLNHVMIAAELNRRFNTDVFTPEITQRKLDRIRTETKKRAKKSKTNESNGS